MNTKIFLITILFCVSNNLNAIIVFLKGTGCAGKTSLCSNLVLNNPSWKVVDEDVVCIKQAIDNVKTTFSEEFKHIDVAIAQENVFHAIVRNQVLFKETAIVQEKTEAEITIHNIRKKLDQFTPANKVIRTQWRDELRLNLLNCIRDYANREFNVVVDSWFLKPEDIEMLKQEYQTIVVLAYCPIKELVNRTLTRNYFALLNRNLYSMRYFHQALMSFMELYDFQEERSEQAIDMITREEINNALDVVELSLVSNNSCGALHPFSREEISSSQLYEYRAGFMKKFLNMDVLYVTPKQNVEFVIKTMEMSAQEAAQQFLKMIESIS